MDYPILFGVLDGNAVRMTPLEAWWFAQGQWQPVHPARAYNEASELSEADFKERFPTLIALPPRAFKPAA